MPKFWTWVIAIFAVAIIVGGFIFVLGEAIGDYPQGIETFEGGDNDG